MGMETIKALNEQIGNLEKEQDAAFDVIKAETRAFTVEEEEAIEVRNDEIERLKRTVDALRKAELNKIANSEFGTEEAEERGVPVMADTGMEVRSSDEIMSDYMRGKEVRANEMTITSTGAIVPSEFSDDIIRKAVNMSGILQMISIVNSKGTYKQIIADNDKKISAGWTDEIAEITATDASFKTLEIGHEKLAALSKVSLEVINQNDFDIVNEVKYQQAEDIAVKLETAVIQGTGVNQPYGLTTKGTPFALASNSAITADEIVKIYHTLAPAYQPNAAWLMSNDTLCKIRLLKDTTGQYLFHQNEMTGGYVGTILGKPVMISDYIDDIGYDKETNKGNKAILFGDFGRAYKANVNPEMTMQQLDEKYAEFGMKGFLSIAWLGGRPVNEYAYVTVSCADNG